MTDSFVETDDITIQPNDVNVPYKFSFYPCTTPISNDGAIPFATNITSHTVTAHTAEGFNATSQLIANSLLDANSITVYLSYPAHGADTYHLTFIVTLDSAAIMEFDYNHVVAVNL